MRVQLLLDQNVDVIVNAWNRNPFPQWLLIPQGVSAAIRKRAGPQPFRELSRLGLLRLGDAVLTSPGRLPHRAIIHVAGIGLLWRATPESIRLSVLNALELATLHRFRSIAFPLIGAGTGGQRVDAVQHCMFQALESVSFDGDVNVVRFQHQPGKSDCSRSNRPLHTDEQADAPRLAVTPREVPAGRRHGSLVLFLAELPSGTCSRVNGRSLA